ncbi:MAG: dihydropteroate synthase [Solirubrobacterales bacterium]
MPIWRLRDRTLEFPPPLAVGIINVTADSFFSGARSETPERALADGLTLVEAGFDMLDVGAVAARSGPPVSATEEAAELAPAIEGLAARSGVPVLADTFSAEVGRSALAAGAAGINDISGGADAALLELVAGAGCGYVLMHIEGPPRTERRPRSYGDPVEHLRRWFAERIEAAQSRGVDEAQIALDPGLDFDLGVDDDLELLRRLGELRDLGRPLFVALSRKDFLGAVLAGSWAGRAPAEDREAATLAAVTLAVAQGADVLRLHDATALDAMRVAAAIAGGGAAGTRG